MVPKREIRVLPHLERPVARRTYGDPANGVHAVQLELSEATYMNESFPFAFREDLAVRLRPQLRALIEEFCRLGRGR